MPFAHLARRFALLLVAALCPASALALNETYEGVLMPISRDAPIPIVVQIKDLGEFVTGRMKVSSPLSANVAIDSGRNLAGNCNLSAALNSTTTLRLYGTCNTIAFEGTYTIYYTQWKTVARGTFRLARKAPEADKGRTKGSGTVSASAVTACLKANTRCLTACPRGDTDAEYLCANHCRTKLQICKGKASQEIDANEGAQ